jgi:hypothetical protein
MVNIPKRSRAAIKLRKTSMISALLAASMLVVLLFCRETG